jgi:hypothetical protein
MPSSSDEALSPLIKMSEKIKELIISYDTDRNIGKLCDHIKNIELRSLPEGLKPLEIFKTIDPRDYSEDSSYFKACLIAIDRVKSNIRRDRNVT